MEDQTSFDFIVLRERGAWELLCLIRTRPLADRFPIRLAPREPVPATGQFLDGLALLELRQHLKQRASINFLQVQALCDLAAGSWFTSNLQETQYVIGAEVRRTWHEVSS
jgi:hypothetical protein